MQIPARGTRKDMHWLRWSISNDHRDAGNIKDNWRTDMMCQFSWETDGSRNHHCGLPEGHEGNHVCHVPNCGKWIAEAKETYVPTDDELAVGQMVLAARNLNEEIKKVAGRGITVSVNSLSFQDRIIIRTFGSQTIREIVPIPVVEVRAEKRETIKGVWRNES
jgi:hypothetical protein